MKRKLVIIGAGMASGRALEHLLEADADGFDITLFNAEPRGNYNRIMLSPVLSGEKTYEEIVTHDDEWYAANGVTCRFGERIDHIDRTAKTVTAANGDVLPYDKLVFGTGSNPFIIRSRTSTPSPSSPVRHPNRTPSRELEPTRALPAPRTYPTKPLGGSS